MVARGRGESGGKIDAFQTGPRADYAVADCSRPAGRVVPVAESFHWRRHLLLVKQPDYLVIWDEVSSPQPAEWFLHTTAEKLIWDKNRVVAHTAYDADLEVLALSPARPLVPNENEGRFGATMPDPKNPGKVTGKEGFIFDWKDCSPIANGGTASWFAPARRGCRRAPFPWWRPAGRSNSSRRRRG